MAASSSNSVFRYIEEVTPGVTPATAPTTYRVTGGTLTQSAEFTEDNELRSDRGKGDSVLTSGSVSGSLNVNLSHKTHNTFIEALLASTFTPVAAGGTKSVSDMTFNTATHTIASAGASLPVLEKGQWFSIAGAAAANNNGIYKASSTTAPTTSAIVVDTVVKDVGTTNAVGATCVISSSRIKQGNADLRSFTIERELSDVSRFFKWAGCYVSSMNLSYTIGDKVNGSLGFMGMKEEVLGVATAFGTSPVAATTTPNFNSVTGTYVLVDGASLGDSCIESFTLDVNANLRERRCLGGGLAASDIGSDQFTITGSSNMYFGSATSASLYGKKLQDQVITFSVAVTDQNGNGFAITYPRAKITQADVDGGSMGSDVMMSFNFTAATDPVTNTMIIIDVIGSVA
jgi:hypothetical protein